MMVTPAHKMAFQAGMLKTADANIPIATSLRPSSITLKGIPDQAKSCCTDAENRLSRNSVGVITPARRHRCAKSQVATRTPGTLTQYNVNATKPYWNPSPAYTTMERALTY